jgi:hypothetical protein
MDRRSISQKMSRIESGRHTMVGSRADEGLKGSEVSTISRDDNDKKPITTRFSQELRRRSFFDHTGRSRRPTLQRRNADPIVPRTSITTLVETVVDLAGRDAHGDMHLGASNLLAPAAAAPSSPTEQLTVPAVPKFPTYPTPTMPTVPAYPFNTPHSQSVLSSPPPSPAPSDTSFTPTASLLPSSTPKSPPSSNSSNPSYRPSDSSGTAKPTTPASTMSVSYSNTTVTTSTDSSQTTSTSLISSSDETTFSTRISSTSSQYASGSTIAGAAATLSATGSGSVSLATPGSSSDPTSSSNGPVAPNTPQVVGGVVGAIAGLTFILLVLLFFLRRYRRQLQDRGELLEPDPNGRDGTNTMSMRSSHTPLVAAVTASLKRMRPGSSQTTATAETGISERGFQRVAGRKIETVLKTGGDGYGGNYGAFEKEVGMSKETGVASSSNPEAQPLASTSFFRNNSDYDLHHGSGTSTPIVGQAYSATDSRDFGDASLDYNRVPSPDAIAVIRPSPARSPVTTSAGPTYLAPQKLAPTMPSDIPPRFIPDGVGRSLISQDGSRGSRFTESV